MLAKATLSNGLVLCKSSFAYSADSSSWRALPLGVIQLHEWLSLWVVVNVGTSLFHVPSSRLEDEYELVRTEILQCYVIFTKWCDEDNWCPKNFCQMSVPRVQILPTRNMASDNVVLRGWPWSQYLRRNSPLAIHPFNTIRTSRITIIWRRILKKKSFSNFCRYVWCFSCLKRVTHRCLPVVMILRSWAFAGRKTFIAMVLSCLYLAFIAAEIWVFITDMQHSSYLFLQFESIQFTHYDCSWLGIPLFIYE